MILIATGVSFRTLPLHVRERLSIEAQQLPSLLRQLQQLPGVSELMLLATCNRTEAYALVDSLPTARALQHALCQSLACSEALPENAWYMHGGRTAIHHLFRVAASLDSQVLGETQISGQVKAAYHAASDAGTIGRMLHGLLHRAFTAAKRVRNETGLGRGCASISSVAIDLFETHVCRRYTPTLLVIGAGKMGSVAARVFAERNLGHLSIINRTWEKTKALAGETNAKAWTWEHLPNALAQADAVITCCAAQEPLITSEMVTAALADGGRSRLLLIDLGLPRDIHSDVRALENVQLFDLDDLTALADRTRQQRADEALAAERIVAEEVDRSARDLLESPMLPVIAELSQRWEAIRRRELARALEQLGSLTDEQRRVIDVCTSSIVGKLLHDPITALKSDAADSELLLAAAQQLFALHDGPLRHEQKDTSVLQ